MRKIVYQILKNRRDTLKKLLPYMKKYRIYAILTPILMILEVLGDIMLPYLMSRIVDVGIVNRDTQYVVKIGLIMIGATILSMIFGIISAHFGAKAGHGFASEIRKETLDRKSTRLNSSHVS